MQSTSVRRITLDSGHANDYTLGVASRVTIVVSDLRPDTRVYMLDRAEISNELFRFSTTALQWEQLDAPVYSVNGIEQVNGLSGHGMAAIGPDLYVFGYSQATYKNELWWFSMTTLQWEFKGEGNLDDPPSRRYLFGMATVANDLYVFGGSTGFRSGDESRCAERGYPARPHQGSDDAWRHNTSTRGPSEGMRYISRARWRPAGPCRR